MSDVTNSAGTDVDTTNRYTNEWLAHAKTVLRRRYKAADVNTPRDVLDEMARNGTPHIKMTIASNPGASASTLRYLFRDGRGRDGWSGLCERLGWNPSTPTDLVTDIAETWMSGDGDAAVMLAVAANPNAAVHILEQLMALDWLRPEITRQIHRSIASNPAANAAMLKTLGRNQSVQVRARVGANANTNTATLDELATNMDEAIRYAVGGNSNTRAETLCVLAVDSSEAVREAVFLNSSYR